MSAPTDDQLRQTISGHRLVGQEVVDAAAELLRLRAAVSRVRELHQRCEQCSDTPDHCTSCDGLEWPCPTARALGSEDV